mmetsp:Transcript_35638/g.41938  ORF Transcript_35638/g.41938 Transcript_35638/m.41938 type:complete len:548 (+) Transcript_35638:95-1738(+)
MSSNYRSPPSSPKLTRKYSTSSSSESPRRSSKKCEISSPNDRFIPSRRSLNLEVSKFYLNEDTENNSFSIGSPTSPHQETEFESHLRTALLESPKLNHHSKRSLNQSFDSPNSCDSPHDHLNSPSLGPRVLNFSSSDLTSSSSSSLDSESLFQILNNHKSENVRKKASSSHRVIQSAPSRILDAPDIVDDYYLNLISWSNSNVLAVALGPSIYTWNADKNSVQQICTLEQDNIVTSVSWAQTAGSNLLAVGCNSSEIQLWDTTTSKLIRKLPGHTARVSSLSWNPSTTNILSSGSRDSKILNHDIRIGRSPSTNGNGNSAIISTLLGHKQEVCGLKWNHSGNTLASGGNENYLCLWDVSFSGSSSSSSSSATTSTISPRLTLTDHKAAVKALSFAPFKSSLLASGGGTADRCIKFWNIHTGNLVNSTDTGSQVCSLLWSPNKKEIVSGHGFSQNQLVLWKYGNGNGNGGNGGYQSHLTKMMEFTGHTARVLHLDQSPDGSSVVSAGADETLRFWKIFGKSSNKLGKTCDQFSSSLSSSSSVGSMSIR